MSSELGLVVKLEKMMKSVVHDNIESSLTSRIKRVQCVARLAQHQRTETKRTTRQG